MKADTGIIAHLRKTGAVFAAFAIATPAASENRAVLHNESELAVVAAPQVAWDAFKIFGAIHTWHPATSGTVLLVGKEGEAGAVRELQVAGGASVISELLDYSEERLWLQYRISKAHLPLSNYVGEMWVTPAAVGGSVIHWKADFQRPAVMTSR